LPTICRAAAVKPANAVCLIDRGAWFQGRFAAHRCRRNLRELLRLRQKQNGGVAKIADGHALERGFRFWPKAVGVRLADDLPRSGSKA